MSAIKAIYKAEKEFVLDPEFPVIYAHILYNGKWYSGTASLHPEDKDFFSEKVGKTIALSRARQSALNFAIKEAEQIANVKYQMYQEVTGYGSKAPAEVDPTGAFLRNSLQSFANAQVLKECLIEEQDSLDEYLRDHKRALKSVKLMREKAKDN